MLKRSRIKELEGKIVDRDIKIQTQRQQIAELEFLLRSFNKRNSEEDRENILANTIKRIEIIIRENFKLKREIAAEKKRYIDLSEAFVDLKSS